MRISMCTIVMLASNFQLQLQQLAPSTPSHLQSVFYYVVQLTCWVRWTTRTAIHFCSEEKGISSRRTNSCCSPSKPIYKEQKTCGHILGSLESFKEKSNLKETYQFWLNKITDKTEWIDTKPVYEESKCQIKKTKVFCPAKPQTPDALQMKNGSKDGQKFKCCHNLLNFMSFQT